MSLDKKGGEAIEEGEVSSFPEDASAKENLLAHLSAEQVEDIYRRYLEGERTSDLIKAFSINTPTNALLKLLPPLARDDLICPHCGACASQKRAARNRAAIKPGCTGCDHSYPVHRDDYCECSKCTQGRICKLNGSGVDHSVTYEALTFREKTLLLAAITLAESRDAVSFPLAHLKRKYRRLAPTVEYHDRCIDELFKRNIILVSADTPPSALQFYRRYKDRCFFRWTSNVRSLDASGGLLKIDCLRVLIAEDLLRRKYELGPILMEFFYELAEEELMDYVRYCVESTKLSFKAETATRSVLKPLLSSNSISAIFSFIWKSVKQADNSLSRGAAKCSSHAGNFIPGGVVRAAEFWEANPDKRKEYARPKYSTVCQLSEIIYRFILDDPDGAFKTPLPRYVNEIMRPVLEGVVTAQEAKIFRRE